MLASLLIIAVSVVLLVYWFRYTCLLLLRSSETAVAGDTRFSFGSVRDRLRTETQLDPVHLALQRDHQLITYLLQNAPGLELDSLEERMLLWDYKLMQCWYAFTRTAAPAQARHALSEMASVLAVLGGKIGERVGAQTQA